MKAKPLTALPAKEYMIGLLTVVVLFPLLSSLAVAKDPDCTGVDRWPTNMAFVLLKNAGITDNQRIDFTKTRTVRLASERIGKGLYRQIHHVKFIEKTGNAIEVITSNEVSDEECSMSEVNVFVIRQQLGKQVP